MTVGWPSEPFRYLGKTAILQEIGRQAPAIRSRLAVLRLLTRQEPGGGSTTEFIQIIELTTSRIDRFNAALDKWLKQAAGQRAAGALAARVR